jgi:hypothetical protein
LDILLYSFSRRGIRVQRHETPVGLVLLPVWRPAAVLRCRGTERAPVAGVSVCVPFVQTAPSLLVHFCISRFWLQAPQLSFTVPCIELQVLALLLVAAPRRVDRRRSAGRCASENVTSLSGPYRHPAIGELRCQRELHHLESSEA